ncbi:uncharacterized protein EDB93DRAFT_1113085 [Suillus bovinus]|uniref:uncharacterized protein n=1 Tax=Suillus bovinus TaxID=48563 RepID=UPI001B870187|nr:uncharacterized protein EDB93DRAFT_1113085 [Suillus bovinus]KAG2160036.1 hypothetical protein EDB93DRAFT_1113085 [Suillus bovinus]
MQLPGMLNDLLFLLAMLHCRTLRQTVRIPLMIDSSFGSNLCHSRSSRPVPDFSITRGHCQYLVCSTDKYIINDKA